MKISVIIPALNAGQSLEAALTSVWNQTHQDYEIIVMDGGSTDGTRELLTKHNDRIKYWQSAPDEGTTHAINDGFKKCSGDLVMFLCADDQVHDPDVFKNVIREFEEHPETQVLCATLKMVDPTGLVEPFLNPSNREDIRRQGSLHLPGAFFRHEVINQRPLSYDVDIANDYEMFAYLTQRTTLPIRVSPLVTVAFSLGGRTNNPKTDFKKINECFIVRRKYFGFWNSWYWYTWDMFIAILRNLNFRPFTWARKIRQRLKGKSTAYNS